MRQIKAVTTLALMVTAMGAVLVGVCVSYFWFVQWAAASLR
jgi:hypothetical protein